MNPRVYIASLSDYNAGRLHGAWIDADQDPDALQDEIDAMLAQSPEPNAEEWAVHDYDDMPNLGEYPSLDSISEIARGIAEHGEAFRAYADIADTPTIQDFEACYIGEYRDAEDFAASYLDDTGQLAELPEWARNYFDFAAYGRDCVLGGDVWASDGYWFWSR